MAAALSVPVQNPSQTQLGLRAGYGAGRSTFTLRAQAVSGLSSYGLGAGFTWQVSDAFTVDGDLGYSVSAAGGVVRAGVRLVWTASPKLSVQAQANAGGSRDAPARDPAATGSPLRLGAATQVTYQFAPNQVVPGSLGYSDGQPVAGAQ